MLKAITAMFENGVCELVEPLKGCTIIGNKWVFRVKSKADGTLDKLQAILVALRYGMTATYRKIRHTSGSHGHGG